jgi:ATP-dependent Lhr-like helicase
VTEVWEEVYGTAWTHVSPFFARFKSPTKAQNQAPAPILHGKDTLLVAPTASGKTEAVVAPLVARNAHQLTPQQGPSIIYVAPTRALVADIVTRLSAPLHRLGAIIGERTSDRHSWSPGKPCSVLVTTPESLDSLSCRHPETLHGLQAIVLDEIHLLEGGPRGLQLLLTVHRIETTLKRTLQRIVLSATVPQLDDLAKRWLRDPAICVVHGVHELDMRVLQAKEDDWMPWLVTALDDPTFPSEKALLFAPTRRATEAVARELGPLLKSKGWIVRSHHASLGSDERAMTEREFAASKGRYLVCATSTLEVGIDIGDVDMVILLGPPWSLSSFLQRIGRGCRRTNRRRVLGIAFSPTEIRTFEALAAAARAGRSDGRLTSPLYAVAVQQIGASLWQRRQASAPGHKAFLTETTVKNLLAPAATPETLESFARTVLQAAQEIGYADSQERVGPDGRYQAVFPGKDLDLAAGRIDFHVNFSGAGGDHEVVIEGSGKRIGEVSNADFTPGTIFHLGGRVWRIMGIHGKTISVRPVGGALGQVPEFLSKRGGYITRELAEEIAKIVWPPWQTGNIASFEEQTERETLVHYAHFLGKEAASFLAAHIRRYGIDVKNVGALTMTASERWELRVPTPTAEDLRALAAANPGIPAILLDYGNLFPRLPEQIRQAQSLLAFDWAEMARRLATIQHVVVQPGDLAWAHPSSQTVITI